MQSAPIPFDFDQILPGGFHMPARMTALPLADGTVALVSPIPIDDALAARVAALGEVRYLIAPNLFHHLYLGDAIGRYPGAVVLAPPGLRSKRPDLRIDGALDAPLPEPLARAVQIVRIEGAPSLDEFVLFHEPSATLVVTDLVFNVTRPRGLVAQVAMWLVGCHGRLAQSRSWRFLVKDRRLARASYDRLLSLPVRRLVMAHGEVVTNDARARLTAALAWLAPARPALAPAAP